MSRDYLRKGHILRPSSANDGGYYQIVAKIGEGSFGITYEALRRQDDVRSSTHVGHLVEDMQRVVIKEFYPEEIARKANNRVVPNVDEGYDDLFHSALRRFRREAERLYFLTNLRALRGAMSISRAHDDDPELIDDINAFLANVKAVSRLAASRDFISRLSGDRLEAAERALAHSSLPIVYDFFDTDTSYYYVMEYLEGGTLKDRMNTRRKELGVERVVVGDRAFDVAPPLSGGALRNFTVAALNALEELHNGVPDEQIIHCDLKPGNIMFRSINSDAPILIDFGLARNVKGEGSSSAMLGGTRVYSPIELEVDSNSFGTSPRAGRPTDTRPGPWTDIYSMAIILRMLATGVDYKGLPEASVRNIQWSSNRDDLLARVPPYPKSLPKQFCKGIDAGLAILPQDRPQSIAAWRTALGIDTPIVGETGGWGDKQHVTDTDGDATIKSGSSQTARAHLDGKAVAVKNPTATGQHSTKITKNHIFAAGALLGVGAVVAGGAYLMSGSPAPTPTNTVVAVLDNSAANTALAENAADNAASPGVDTNQSVAMTNTAARPAPPPPPPSLGKLVDTPPAPTPVSLPPPPPVVSPLPPPPPRGLRYNELGLTVQPVTNETQLSEWNRQGITVVNPVIVVGVDKSAARYPEDVHMGQIFVRSCYDESATAALGAANRGNGGCLMLPGGGKVTIKN